MNRLVALTFVSSLMFSCSERAEAQAAQPRSLEVATDPLPTGPAPRRKRPRDPSKVHDPRRALSPVWTLSLSGSLNATIEPGWPLVAKVALQHPDLGSVPDQIRAETLQVVGGSSWSELISLQLIEPSGQKPTLHWRKVTREPATLTLDGHHRNAEAVWLLDPAESRKLKPGRYELVLALDSRNSSAGWKGLNQGVAAILDVRASGVRREEYFDIAEAYHARNGTPFPIAELEAFVASAPDSGAALYLLGRQQAKQGKKAEALASYRRAVVLWRKHNPRADEGGPLHIIDAIRDLESAP
jgi:hypothetical protein